MNFSFYGNDSLFIINLAIITFSYLVIILCSLQSNDCADRSTLYLQSVLSSQTPIARRSSRLRRTRRGGNDSSPVRHSDEAGHHSAEEKMDSSPEPPAPQRLFTRDMDTTQSDEEIARACEDAEEKVKLLMFFDC